MVERWLKAFAGVSLTVFFWIGIVGIIALIASLIFTIMGTGTIEVQREPLMWLALALALFSVALGFLSIHLSFKKPSVGGENMSNDKKRNDLDIAVREISDEIAGISEPTKALREKYSAFDNWAIVLTYISSKRLVEHSKALNKVTNGLIGIGVGMIVLAIVQLIRLW